MSVTSNGSSSSINRKPAKRAFAAEFDDATEIIQPGDDDRAAKYALLPSGERANRLFVVGTVTQIENIGTTSDYMQARVVGPTGTFFVYAGKYQPDEMARLKQIDTPEFVAVVGKPRKHEREEEGDVLTSLTPEAISVVNRATREKWVVETGEQTLERIDDMEAGESDHGDLIRETYDELDQTGYRETVLDTLADSADVELDLDMSAENSGSSE